MPAAAAFHRPLVRERGRVKWGQCSSELGLLPPPLWGRGGEGGDAVRSRWRHLRRIALPPPPTPPQPAAGLPASGRILKWPNPGRPGFGWGGEHTEYAAPA